MPVYESYETVEVPRRHRSTREPRYADQPAYKEVHETRYIPTDMEYQQERPQQFRQDLTLRRQESDSIEEIPRDFAPPGYGDYRSRSAERGPSRRHQYEDPRDYDRYERKGDRHGDGYLGVEVKHISRRRSLSRNQKIASAVGGAALAIGAKELVDYQKAKKNPDSPRERNLAMNAAVGAAGAFAGWEGAQVYEKVKEKKDSKKEAKYTREVEYDRDGHVIDYEEDVRESRPKPSRRKSIVETAMGLAGLGAGAKALGGRDRDDDRHRGRRDSYSDDDRSRRHRSRTRSTDDNMAKFQAAAKAALLAGATEAYRLRKEPGGWDGAKAKRILTAAGTAGAVGGAVSRGEDDGKSKRHLMEAVIGGLAGTKAVHGSRNELDVDRDGRSIRDRSRSRSRFGRDRSRSRGGGGGASAIPIAALATGAMGLLAKKAHSRSRSRSRGGRRRRSDSEDSFKSRGKRSRSKSVTDFARKGIAALGLGGAAAAAGRSRSRSRDREVVEKTTIRRERRRRGDSRDRGYESSDDEYDRRRGDNRSRGISRDRESDYDDRRSNRDRGSGGRNRRVAEGKQNVSDSDSLGSSTDDEKRIKKMKGRQFLTAGLATVASVHAAHGVYQSYEQRNARRKAVLEGDLSLQDARKMKAKARLQDAASIAIAVLGVKGAVSGKSLGSENVIAGDANMQVEWQDMNEKRHEYQKLENEKNERHEKRLERRKSIAPGSSSNPGRAPNRSLTMGPGDGGARDESDDDRDGRYSNSRRPNYQRHTSFPNRSEPDLQRYYEEGERQYPPPPAPGSGYAGAPYPASTKLPPPPLGYDYDRR